MINEKIYGKKFNGEIINKIYEVKDMEGYEKRVCVKVNVGFVEKDLLKKFRKDLEFGVMEKEDVLEKVDEEVERIVEGRIESMIENLKRRGVVDFMVDRSGEYGRIEDFGFGLREVEESKVIIWYNEKNFVEDWY